MAQISPAELAARRERPLRVSGLALGNPTVIQLLSEHYPDLVTPARVSQRALNDDRVITLLSEHCPELVIERGESPILTAELRARRMATGTSAADFAAAIGISESHYRNVELGHKTPSDEDLLLIASRLGCESSDLLARTAA